MHGRRLQRCDARVGAGRRIRARSEELRAEIRKVPAPGEVQSPVQRGADLDQHVDDCRRRRADIRLSGQFEQRVPADGEVHDVGIDLQGGAQPVGVTQ